MDPAHDRMQARLCLDADARDVGQRDVAINDGRVVGKAAERLEHVRVGLVAAESEAGGNVERHLVAAVRDAAARRPAVVLEHLQRPQIFDQAVRQGAIELQPVAVAAHPAVPDQVARVLHREQVLAGRHRRRVVLRESRLQRVVERVTGLLVPEEAVRLQRPGVRDGRLQIEAPVGVDGEPAAGSHDLQHRLDAHEVVVEWRPADLHLHDGVPEVEVPAHLVLQRRQVLAGVVVPAGRVDEHLVVDLPVVVALGQHAGQRLAFDLGDGIPHRHVHRADRHRPLAVSSRLLVGEHRRPDAVRIEVVARVVQQRVRIGLAQAGQEALGEQPLLRVAAVGVEAVPDDRRAVADDVGDHRHDADGHLREVDVRVADRRCDGDDVGVDGGDVHGRTRGPGHGARVPALDRVLQARDRRRAS